MTGFVVMCDFTDERFNSKEMPYSGKIHKDYFDAELEMEQAEKDKRIANILNDTWIVERDIRGRRISHGVESWLQTTDIQQNV